MTASFHTRSKDAAWVSQPPQISSAVAASIEETFVSYPEADDVLTQCEWRIVSSRRLRDPHLIVLADEKNGSGAIVRWVCRRHRPFRVPSQDSPVVPVLVTDLPLLPESDDLLFNLASALGLLRCRDWERLRQRFQAASVRLVFVRNAHEFGNWPAPKQHAVLRQLLTFAEEAGIGLVLCALPSFQRSLIDHRDLLGAVPRLKLPSWTPARLGPFLEELDRTIGPRRSKVPWNAAALCADAGGCIGEILRLVEKNYEDPDRQ